MKGRQTGEVIEYHPNGKISKKCIIVNGKMKGPATFYYDNEKIMF